MIIDIVSLLILPLAISLLDGFLDRGSRFRVNNLVCFLGDYQRYQWYCDVFMRRIEKVAREECDGSRMRRHRPPSLIGRASRSLSVKEHNGCPVNAGMRC